MSNSIVKHVRASLHDLKPYIPGKPIADVQRELGLDDVIKLASNENPVGPSPKAQAAIQAALTDLHRYPDGGQVVLKSELAKHLGVSEDMFLIGNGSDEVISFLCATFVEPGEEIVVPSPSFSEYKFASTVMAGKTVEVPLREGFEYNLDDFAEAITEHTRIVFLCSPNNPTGTYIRHSDLEKFLEKIPSDILVVIDEAYNEYVEAPDYAQGLEFLKQGYNVAVMRTFSKLYALASLRVGYTIAKSEIVSFVNRVREPFNVNHLAQVAAIAALHDEEHIALSRRVNSEGKQALYKGFSSLGLRYIPTETNFILVDTGVNSKELFQSLLKKGVIIRDGGFFGLPTWIRVSIGLPEENERFLAALKESVSELSAKV
ncbi:histidinol-phosphate transaminase [Effusibacillus lacus]|uniref:Histidinol-phosphate aminotransferase n=1 Tax=Effusibacillus lacus TaxID=1348429 RepID=A0A292YQ88_9BACL|nr:histidinol-phosphate transaminase [Effusibacillus lacus]TCS70094.1 histidinol-phosphate aminotransferase [Effusibacillus lacus]GAX91069.1 histidinol-phosphate transaminase [Effusibacillus lacus]